MASDGIRWALQSLVRFNGGGLFLSWAAGCGWLFSGEGVATSLFEQSLAQQELDLSIDAAQIIIGPPPQFSVEPLIDSQQKGLSCHRQRVPPRWPGDSLQ
jgi:hypothetical protein